MRVRHALALGAIQGLSEFLPVSSSAHLALARAALGHGRLPRAFDIGLHLGTTAALIVVTAPELRRMLRAGAGDVRAVAGLPARSLGLGSPAASSLASRGETKDRRPGSDYASGWRPGGAGAKAGTEEQVRQAGSLLLAVLFGTVPAVAAGAILHRPLAVAAGAPRLIALGLLAGTAAMAALDRDAGAVAGETGPLSVSYRQAWWIGVAQATALMPGLSRAGMTLAAGTALGLDRAAALRFSLLLALPVTVAAVARSAGELGEVRRAAGVPAFATGIGASFVTGLAGVVLLRRLVLRFGQRPFLPYRLALAAVIWRRTRKEG